MVLRDAYSIFQKRYPNVEVLKQIQDASKRVYCYRIANRRRGTEAYFAAKASLNGGELSIHRDLFETLRRENKPLFIGVKSADHFNYYKFSFADIDREHWENDRQGVVMVNFHIRHGESLQERAAHPVTDALKKELGAEFQKDGAPWNHANIPPRVKNTVGAVSVNPSAGE